MSDERDWSWLGRGASAPPPPVEHRLWALVKGPRRVECRVRQVPHGAGELRIVVDGELVWSRVRPSLALLEQDADQQLRAFEAKGWTLAGPRA